MVQLLSLSLSLVGHYLIGGYFILNWSTAANPAELDWKGQSSHHSGDKKYGLQC